MSGGYGKINGKDGNTFSKENQPSPELKAKGKKRAKLIREIAAQIIKGDSREAMKDLADYLGVSVDEIDLETALHLKQMEKALKKGDTAAYNAVMDRIKGKPVQEIKFKEPPKMTGVTFKDAPEANIS